MYPSGKERVSNNKAYWLETNFAFLPIKTFQPLKSYILDTCGIPLPYYTFFIASLYTAQRFSPSRINTPCRISSWRSR